MKIESHQSPLRAYIADLPQADIPVEGVKGYISQAQDHQIVFMEFDRDCDIPPIAMASNGARLFVAKSISPSPVKNTNYAQAIPTTFPPKSNTRQRYSQAMPMFPTLASGIGGKWYK